jgi:hypothetical protein
LLGDFNAKSGKLSDYVKPDEELLDIFDLYEDIDLISYMYDYENLLREILATEQHQTRCLENVKKVLNNF